MGMTLQSYDFLFLYFSYPVNQRGPYSFIRVCFILAQICLTKIAEPMLIWYLLGWLLDCQNFGCLWNLVHNLTLPSQFSPNFWPTKGQGNINQFFGWPMVSTNW